MPLSVACSCGKEFKVMDELAGSSVRCLVCDALVPIPVPGVVEEEFEPEIDDGSPTRACPTCAEQIPKTSRTCPLCKEPLPTGKKGKFGMDPAERELINARITESLQSINTTTDDLQRGGFLSVKSIVALCFLAFFGALFLIGIGSRNGEGFGILGFFFGLISFIAAIVSIINDQKAATITTAKTAKDAFERFLNTAKTGRGQKAFGALVPMARNVSFAETIRFKNPKIDNNQRRMSFNDPESFGAYWRANFSGPSGASRTTTIKGIRSVGKTPEGYEVVEARIEVTSFSSWLYLTILLGVLIAVIIIYSVQQKEEIVIRKTLVKHNNRWYLLDGSLEGELDRML